MEYPTTFLGWAGLIGFGGLGFVFTITLVVFVHELGHFLAARYFGVKVESFSIGFGRALAGFTDRYGTYWKVGWLPLGGYVKFWGDEGVSSTPDHEKIDRASAAERAGSFHHKALWKKAIIALGGPVANFILALVILTGLFWIYGTSVVTAQIGALAKGLPAELAGFKVGDTVLAIDGSPVTEFQDIITSVGVSQGQQLIFRVRRDGKVIDIPVTPQQIEKEDPFGNKIKDAGIGVRPVIPGKVSTVAPGSAAERAGLKADDIVVAVDKAPVFTWKDIAAGLRAANGGPVKVTFYRDEFDPKLKRNKAKKSEVTLTPAGPLTSTADSDRFVEEVAGFTATVPGAPESETLVRFGPLEAASRAAGTVWFIVVKTLSFIGQLLTGTGDYQQLSGPIGIAQVSGQVLVFFGVVALINLAAVLSVSIGLLNLFPIPMLDGGHLLYYGIEAVRGRPLGERAQELGFRIGFALVVGLMLFATWNDITKFKLF
ncbi:MAG: RIP metalloprotease RseP [Alphaproteobacteria bacterium]|nr:RIP metalloprotease RseP [Alphaproteobacteria bacterium]